MTRRSGWASAHSTWRVQQALTIAEELGMRPLAAHCQLGLGRLQARAGKRGDALRHLETAAALYRDMDVCAWLEHAVTESERLAQGLATEYGSAWPSTSWCGSGTRRPAR